jgi:hypothetical protein
LIAIGKSFRDSLAFVIASSNPDWVDVTPTAMGEQSLNIKSIHALFLWLGVYLGISVNLCATVSCSASM